MIYWADKQKKKFLFLSTSSKILKEDFWLFDSPASTLENLNIKFTQQAASKLLEKNPI